MTYDYVALVGLYTGIAAIVDLRMSRIPNFVTVPAAVLGLLYHCLAPQGQGPGLALAGLGVGFLLLLLPWLLGGGGMGDVKLLAALGAWLGPVWILAAFGMAAVTSGLIALAVVTGAALTQGVSGAKRRYLIAGNSGGQVNGGGRATAGGQANGSGQRRPRRRTLPFAVPVALATWLLLGWLVWKQGLGI